MRSWSVSSGEFGVQLLIVLFDHAAQPRVAVISSSCAPAPKDGQVVNLPVLGIAVLEVRACAIVQAPGPVILIECQHAERLLPVREPIDWRQRKRVQVAGPAVEWRRCDPRLDAAELARERLERFDAIELG